MDRLVQLFPASHHESLPGVEVDNRRLRDVGGASDMDSGERLVGEAGDQLLVEEAAPLHHQRGPRPVQRRHALLGPVGGQLVRPRHQLRRRQHLADDTGAQRLGRVEIGAGEKEVPSAVEPEQRRPDDLHPVRRRQPGDEVRRVLKHGVIGGEHDVGQQWQLGMGDDRPVDRRDHGHFDVEEGLQHAAAVGSDGQPGRVDVRIRAPRRIRRSRNRCRNDRRCR